MDNYKLINEHLKKIENETVPQVSIDCTVFGFHDNQLKVLLLSWGHTDKWCLPGGRIFHHEHADEAAVRILKERTSLEDVFLQQFHTFGDSQRYKNESLFNTLSIDPSWLSSESHLLKRTISIGYYALVNFEQARIRPDEFSEACSWWDVKEVPELLFDHNNMVQLALKTLRRQLNYQPVGYNLLSEKFTMPELQRLYETLLGRELDRRNFQKKMLSYDILERLDERKTGSANKSPFLYRFVREKYEEALKEEILFGV